MEKNIFGDSSEWGRFLNFFQKNFSLGVSFYRNGRIFEKSYQKRKRVMSIQIDRTKVKAAATNKTLVAAVKTVLEAKALVETIRPVVNADHKAEIEANEYTFENSRRFTYEDHLKGAGYLMNESQWQTYAERMNDRYKAGPFAYMIEGREVGTCPLLIAENMLIIAQRAMMDVFKSLTGTFDTDDLLCSSNGLENLKHGQDLVIGMVVSQNPNL